jgi:hypothetical protein
MFRVLFAPIIRSTTAAYSHSFVSVENRGFSIKWYGGLFYVDLCVIVFQNLVRYLCAGVCVCVCVSGSVLVLRGHDMWFLSR